MTLTEQEIDAEVSQRQPYCLWANSWMWFFWVPGFGTPLGPHDVPLRIHRHLQSRGQHYPTREAAFADLRQAIRASGEQVGVSSTVL